MGILLLIFISILFLFWTLLINLSVFFVFVQIFLSALNFGPLFEDFLFDFDYAIPMLVDCFVYFLNYLIAYLEFAIVGLFRELFVRLADLLLNNMVGISIDKIELSLFEIAPNVDSIIDNSPYGPEDFQDIQNCDHVD